MIDRHKIDYGGRLEHSIGLDNWPRLYGNRYGTFYKAYRKYYTCNKDKPDEKCEELVKQGLMTKTIHVATYRGDVLEYHITEEGYKHLEKKYNIRIVRY